MAVDLSSISGERCMETIRKMGAIGIRVAGTEAEKEAADWIALEYENLGLVNVSQMEFPCRTFGHSKCVVEALSEKGWEEVASEPAAHSPSTPEGGIEGDLVFLERIPETLEETTQQTEGKVVLIYGSILFDTKKFRRIMESGPAALLVVEDRIHGDWTVAVGGL